jgi:hypothetical protein
MKPDFDALFAGLRLRPTTRRLVEALLVDGPLTPAESVDFGVDSVMHYRALREVLDIPVDERDDEDDLVVSAKVQKELRTRILQLEHALGNGAQLTALVKRYAPQYAAWATFQTSWDVLYGRTTEEQPRR